MAKESIKVQVEKWMLGHRYFVTNPKVSLTVAARECSNDMGIKVSTADKYIRDIKIEWNSKYGEDKLIPWSDTLEALKYDSDFEVKEELEKAYSESDIEERVEKAFPKKNLKEIELDYKKNVEDDNMVVKSFGELGDIFEDGVKEEIPTVKLERDETKTEGYKIVNQEGQVVGEVNDNMVTFKEDVTEESKIQIPEGLCISSITCFGSKGKVDVNVNGVFQQTPRFKNERGEFVPAEAICYKTEEDLDKYYQELKFCFQLKKMLDLKNPTRREK